MLNLFLMVEIQVRNLQSLHNDNTSLGNSICKKIVSASHPYCMNVYRRLDGIFVERNTYTTSFVEGPPLDALEVSAILG